MQRLIEKGLMFGNLVAVESPALVDRYNRALQHLTGKTTALEDFHIDISGYSPEIGMELNDPQYLNPNGCNRQFILLTTEQKTAPLLNAKFSFSRQILRDFITANETRLFGLTARDAVAGELQNSVIAMPSPQSLLSIRAIEVEADSTGGVIQNAAKLTRKIEQFQEDEDAWFDDVLIAEMVGLAKETGDITRNPVALNPVTASVDSYWTEHFGGVYLFRDVEHPALIASGTVPEGLGIESFGIGERNRLAAFLDLNHLVEPIVKAKDTDAAAILRQKMDFIVVEAAADLGEDLTGATRRDLRMVARSIGADLPQAYHGLADLLRWVEAKGDWPKISSEHPSYFYMLRSTAHKHRDLVNRLLAQVAPLDVRQMFICHKEMFYGLYRGWGEAKKSYVADFLAREYAVDKAGTRAALFGPEPGMYTPEAPQNAPEAPEPGRAAKPTPWGRARASAPAEDTDLAARIAAVGPWGAVKRR